MTDTYRFPDGFLWGAGTSGLQHEGSPCADGAGVSAMYRWAHAATNAERSSPPSWMTPPIDTFDVSADLYGRFQSDIQLMREIGLQIYNFEITWPRIIPEGIGAPNEPGLAFYDRLIDAFLGAGITPLCNLYVFDHPAALEERGGWLERDMADHFADYASVLFERFGDRVTHWTTICEIPLVGFFTSGTIGAAPRTESDHLRAIHHLLLGQGRAVQAFRASGCQGQIGNQHVVSVTRPASDSEADVAAAARAEADSNLIYLDPQLRGEYPRGLVDWYGASWPGEAVRDGDLAEISAPIDFFGLDYGTYSIVAHDPSEAGGSLQVRDVSEASSSEDDPGCGAYEALRWVRDRYDMPIIILEYGCPEEVSVADSRVDDTKRLAYLRDYLAGVHHAIADGVDIRAALVWSFLDGWEFGYGLSLRYGLVHVDFETQQRFVKASGRWLAEVIAANGFDSR